MRSLTRALARIASLACAAAALAVVPAHAQTAAPVKTAAPAAKPAPKPAAFDASACYACHAPIKDFHVAGKHKAVGCNACHDGIDAHLANVKSRPVTKMDPAVCGACHQNQFTHDVPDELREDRRGGRSRSRPGPRPIRRSTS